MAEKAPKKMAQAFDAASGILTHTFGDAGTITVKLDDYPQRVRDYFTALGMRTAHRNATIGSEDEGSVGTSASMFLRLKAKVEAWKAGTLRAISSGEEKAPASTIVLEAAVIYKRMKAAMTAGVPIEALVQRWAEFDGADAEGRVPTVESLRPEIEAMDDFVMNPAEVEKAKAAAAEKGEDVEEAAKKVATTRLAALKVSTLFKLATGEAKKARDQAKQAAQLAKLAEEAKAAG